jgi:outer membrane biosynthesis protein TonB
VFDNIGKNLDEEANKRTAKSAFLSLLFAGSAVGFSIGLAAYKTVETVMELGDDEDLVAVDLEDEGLDAAPPPPPPPPPPPAADTPDEEESEDDEEDEEEQDDMSEDIEELDKEVKDEVRTQKKPKGAVGGVIGGQEGGVVGGVVGGVEGGVLGGVLGGGPKVFHHSELEVKKRVQPGYPSAAKPLNLGTQRCKVKVMIDEKGVPYHAEIQDCPKVFHSSAKDAIMKWRWYPPRAEKMKVRAQTLIVFKYVLQG